jgi:hypothetical protein
MKFYGVLGALVLLGTACTSDDGGTDAGAVDSGQVDAATPDLGPNPPPPDAGFGGGLGARCQRSTDCDDPGHHCKGGNYPNTYLRCTVTCGRDEDCYDFAEGAGVTRDEVACEIPANAGGSTRSWCLQTPPPPPDAGPGGDVGEADGGVIGDGGPQPDLGAGQVPGSRCSYDEQCRHGRCVRGFSGDSFCTVPCTSADECAEFRANSGLDEAHSACVDVEGERVCNEVPAVPRPGWGAVLPRGINGVRARITLTENRGFRVRDFYYDGQRHGQEVYIGVSLGPITQQSFVPVSINLRCRGGQCAEGHPCALTNGVCTDADFELVLPEGLAYSQFDRVAIVGMPQALAWSEAALEP